MPFLLIVPALVATWSLGGFHLSLGSSIIRSVFGIDNHIIGGLESFALFFSGSLAAAFVRHRPPRNVMIATTFAISYLAFSLPAVVGGIALHLFGLEQTALVYGGFVILLALVSAFGFGIASHHGAKAGLGSFRSADISTGVRTRFSGCR